VTAHSGVAITVVYVAGVLWALLKSDAGPAERIAVSLLWPLGPLAFVVTVAILLMASLIAYPAVAIAALAFGALVWWAIR
jgi:hypothetical protein